MTTSNYKAIVTEKTYPSFGQMVANTKTPGSKYKCMTKEQFTEATKYVSCFTISIVEF